jgi:ribose transport system ATP-binding protein
MMAAPSNVESPLALRVSGLSKRYPGVRALDGVSLDFASGMITAVVGENGAGKSTLMTIIAGVQHPDSGTIFIDGAPVRTYSPHDMLSAHGVALVPQEIGLVADRSVADNVMLGLEGGLLPSRRSMERRTAELLRQLDTVIDPHCRAGSLTVAEQQIVLIARALARECRILILDEPTASLTSEEVVRLFRLLGRLRADGRTVIYVSHRLPEVFEISDRIHVLRDGQVADSFRTSDVDPQTLVAAMVGRKLADRGSRVSASTGRTALRVKGLTGAGFHDVTFSVDEGETVGVAGLPDSGRSEVVAALFGASASTGEVELAGQVVHLRSPRDAIRAGIGYVPAERRTQGIFPAMSVAANLTVLEIDSLARGGIIRRSEMNRLAAARTEQFGVKGRPNASVGLLSGGNQQKVILSRWLGRSPRLLLLDEPTRGVDVGAKAEIYAQLATAAESGMATLMSSSDLPELLGNCDRIVVMAHGQLVGTLTASTATEESVMALATGAAEGDVAA